MTKSRIRLIACEGAILVCVTLLAFVLNLLTGSLLLALLVSLASGLLLVLATSCPLVGKQDEYLRFKSSLMQGDLASFSSGLGSEEGEAIRYINWVMDDACSTLDGLARGDLAVKPGDAYHGDYAKLRDALNNVIQSINECICDISCATGNAAAYSGHVSDLSRRLADHSVEQAVSIGNLSQSMAMVAERAIHSTKLAHSMAESGENVKELALVGAEQMDNMMQAVQDINDAGKSIEKVIKIIDDIAFQTNILALNAAVEAARAGQHGKGFIVVADEVRQLAGKSANAAQETKRLISNTISKAGEGYDISLQTRNSLEQIIAGIQDVTGSIAEISRGSDTQAQEIKAVNTLLSEQAVAVNQSSSTSEMAAEYGSAIKLQTTQVGKLVRRFRLGSRYESKVSESLARAKDMSIISRQSENNDGSIYKKLIWDDALKMGDDKIDGQHRQLIEMVDGLLASCFNGTGAEEINKAMGFLLEYTQQHFADEEVLQQKCGYPGYQRHKKIHDDFKLKAVQLAKTLEKNGPTPEMIGVINKELVGWLINHIKGEDKKISQYLKQ